MSLQNGGGAILLNYDNDESVKTVFTCFRTNKVLINPLINWSDDDVWNYIRSEHIEINPLYSCGWSRVGCIGCPMATFKERMRHFEQYPKYRDRYIRIADKIVETSKAKAVERGVEYTGSETGIKYFRRWMEDPTLEGQFEFDLEGNITEHY